MSSKNSDGVSRMGLDLASSLSRMSGQPRREDLVKSTFRESGENRRQLAGRDMVPVDRVGISEENLLLRECPLSTQSNHPIYLASLSKAKSVVFWMQFRVGHIQPYRIRAGLVVM